MNIIQTQNNLKDISDNAVVNYYNNPTPEVPMYLALSELMRRKKMRDSDENNKPEEKTVAEDLIQAIQPQQAGIAGLTKEQPRQQAMASQPEMPTQQLAQGGLVDLPVNDTMFQEQNYAGGGIVAFGKGGYTFDPEQDDPTDYASMLEQRLAAENERYRVETPEFGVQLVSSLQHKKALDNIYKTSPTPYDKAIEYYKSIGDPSTTYYPTQLRALENKKREFLYSPQKTTVASSNPAADIKKNKDVDPNAGKGGYTYAPGETATKNASDTYFDTLNQFMPKGSASAGIKSNRLTYDKDLFTKDIADPETAFTKGTDRYAAYMGDNEALRNQETRLAAKESKLADRENKNIGFSMLEAAAPLFSARRGQEGEAITKALQTGLGSYSKGRDKIDDLREKIDDARFSVDQAKRAEKSASFKYGDDDRRTAEAAKQTAIREGKLYKLKTEEFNITADQKDREISIQSELVDLKGKDLARSIAHDNRQLSAIEERIRASDAATQAIYAKIQSTANTDALKYIAANPAEIRALVKKYTDTGKRTYGNPDFEFELNNEIIRIKQRYQLEGINSSNLDVSNISNKVTDAKDLLKLNKTTIE